MSRATTLGRQIAPQRLAAPEGWDMFRLSPGWLSLRRRIAPQPLAGLLPCLGSLLRSLFHAATADSAPPATPLRPRRGRPRRPPHRRAARPAPAHGAPARRLVAPG